MKLMGIMIILNYEKYGLYIYIYIYHKGGRGRTVDGKRRKHSKYDNENNVRNLKVRTINSLKVRTIIRR